MSLELNREYPEADEAALIEKMVGLTVRRIKPQQGRLRRGQHAKPTGCVRGQFTIRDDVPDELRHGVFRQPGRSFPAIVRASNAPEQLNPDGTGTARGIAVKLLDVDGTPAVPGTNPRCQDFLLINHPVFPFATPSEYVAFFACRGTSKVRDLIAVAWYALWHSQHFKIIKDIRSKVVASPFEITYWSASPYWLGLPDTVGSRAVKYSLVPRSAGTEPPRDPEQLPADYLSQAVARHLKARPAEFDFRVQLQADPVAMPVEDVSVEWDENVSKPIPVAMLTIGAQDVDSPEGRALAEQGETMAFSPWNALAEHRPMGGINRLRREVYLASQSKRGAVG